MIAGLLAIIWWWVALSLLGLAVLPLTQLVFHGLPSQGRGLSRFLGLLITAWCVWLSANLHILSFSVYSCWIWTILIAVVCWGVFITSGGNWRDMLFRFPVELRHQEKLFAGCFLFFAGFRMFAPQIEGTEKLADMSFLASIVRSHWFPPIDAWFSGEPINYFYYGHYLVGFMCKLTGLPASWGFNLGLGLTFALTAVGAYSVLFLITGNRSAGNYGCLFVTFIGNLETPRQLINGLIHGITVWPPLWFNWWNVSRVLVRDKIDITINEFPFWSYILGDLHAHVLSLPLTLFIIALCWRLCVTHGLTDKALIAVIVISGLAIGAIPLVNTWDAPVGYLLILVSVCLGAIQTDNGVKTTIWSIIHRLVPLFIVAMGAYLPFFLHFRATGAKGFGWLPAAMRSPIGLFLLIHGVMLFCILHYFIFTAKSLLKKNSRQQKIQLIGAISGGLLLAFLFTPVVAILVALIGCAIWFLFQMSDRKNLFILILLLIGCMLLLVVEFIYIKDAYGESLRRQNTVFKAYYYSWVLLAIASAYAVVTLNQTIAPSQKIVYRWWRWSSMSIFAGGMLFTLLGFSIRYGNIEALLKMPQRRQITMDGMAFMENRAPGDYQAIKWLDAHAESGSVVLEATGEAFSNYSRISGFTGIPTVLGWANHESIWRDPTWQMGFARTADIERIYKTKDVNEARRLVERYSIDYIYIGHLERKRYFDMDAGKFEELGSIVFQESDATLYKLK